MLPPGLPRITFAPGEADFTRPPPRVVNDGRDTDPGAHPPIHWTGAAKLTTPPTLGRSLPTACIAGIVRSPQQLSHAPRDADRSLRQRRAE